MELNIITRKDYTITTRVKVVLFKEDDYWIAFCPPLNLSSFWKTKAEAKANFVEEMSIFLSETIKKNTLEKYLLGLGWKKWTTSDLGYKAPTRLSNMKKYMNKRNGYEVYEKDLVIPVA